MSLAKRTAMQRYYQVNREELRAKKRAYYYAHQEAQTANTRARYAQLKAAILKYSTTDPDSLFAEAVE